MNDDLNRFINDALVEGDLTTIEPNNQADMAEIEEYMRLAHAKYPDATLADFLACLDWLAVQSDHLRAIQKVIEHIFAEDVALATSGLDSEGVT